MEARPNQFNRQALYVIGVAALFVLTAATVDKLSSIPPDKITPEPSKKALEALAASTNKPAGAPTPVAAGAAQVDGEKVYHNVCFACHDTGAANAPKLGDKTAWQARIATGKDTLYTSALKGKNAMPAKGGNPKLSDAEIKATVDWIVSQAE